MNGAPEVLVVNGQNWLGLSRLPALLDEAGCRVTVFGPAGGVIERSRYVSEVVRAPREPAGLVGALREHMEGSRGRYAWVVVGDDPTLVELSRHKEEAWVRGVIPVNPASRALEYISSKGAFAEAAPGFGVPTPESRVCRTVGEGLTAAEEVGGYPVMVKADVGMAGDGVRKAEDAGELVEAFERLRGRVPLVVQKFVAGRVGVTEILFDRGRVAAFFNSYKRECYPENGPSCVREICDYPGCEGVLANLGRMTGFHGLCGIDWIEDGEGRFYVLELNPRPTSAYHVDRYAGVSFARAVGHFVRGEARVERPWDVGKRRPVVYLFPQHLVACVGKHRRKDLLKWLPGVARHDVPWGDWGVLGWHLRRVGPLVMESVVGSVRRKVGRVWGMKRWVVGRGELVR